MVTSVKRSVSPLSTISRCLALRSPSSSFTHTGVLETTSPLPMSTVRRAQPRLVTGRRHEVNVVFQVQHIGLHVVVAGIAQAYDALVGHRDFGVDLLQLDEIRFGNVLLGGRRR